MFNFILILSLFFGYLSCFMHDKDPDVTVVFIVDQLSEKLLDQGLKHCKYGLKQLSRKGVYFKDATYPHAMPSTPTGHAAIATGAYACTHGVVGYGYLNDDNKFVRITDSDNPEHKVYSSDGDFLDYSKSPDQLMTDSVGDLFCLSGGLGKKETVSASFSLKCRAAVLAGGRSCKAFWLDDKTGGITTSKYYFEKFPKWLKKFNKKRTLKNGQQFFWRPFYNINSSAYKIAQADNYDYTIIKDEFKVRRKVKIDLQDQIAMLNFKRSPYSSHLLFEAAKAFMRKNLDKKLLVYISLSNFDYSGHLLGPDSREQLDLLYYLDFQIGKMMSFVNNLFGSKKSLYILTSDHASISIPEVLQKRGFNLAERIDLNKLVEGVNNAVTSEYGYKNIVAYFESPQLYLDKKIMNKLNKIQKRNIYETIKTYLRKYHGIAQCWSVFDFESSNAQLMDKDCYGNLFLKQFYSKKSGDIVFLADPYKLITEFPTGTSHITPYNYDTHVPLIFMQNLRLKSKKIYQPVSMLQLAATQSKLMGISAPATSCKKILPGLI